MPHSLGVSPADTTTLSVSGIVASILSRPMDLAPAQHAVPRSPLGVPYRPAPEPDTAHTEPPPAASVPFVLLEGNPEGNGEEP